MLNIVFIRGELMVRSVPIQGRMYRTVPGATTEVAGISLQ
jgi:hypothetical protein